MSIYNYFSERYKEIIVDSNFCNKMEFDEQRLLASVMIEFAAPMRYQPNRYNSYTVETDALYEAIEVFARHQGWGTPPDNFDSEELLCKRDLYELFDIIEIQYEQLGSESLEYQTKINNTLDEISSQFRLLNGRFIKIDAQQFEQDLKSKSLARMDALRCEEPLFQLAYEEMLEAFEKYELGDYKDCILKAACSFESVMKVLLDSPASSTSAANALIEALVKTDYFSDIPENVIGIMKDKILLSLPTMRNKFGSGHGQGSSFFDIPKSSANLALNLASSLNTFLVDLYLEKNFANPADKRFEEDELPF